MGKKYKTGFCVHVLVNAAESGTPQLEDNKLLKDRRD